MQGIFLHGLGQTPSSWEKTLIGVTAQMEFFCPSLVGMLRGGEPTYPNLYKAFSEYCRDFSGPFHLCGMSLGGVLALQYGIENPAKIQSLTLIGVPYKMPKTLLAVQTAIFRCMPKAAFRGMGFEKRELMQLTGSMRNLDFSKVLNRAVCPTLVVCGEKDFANKKAAIKMSQRLPKAELRMIANSGHEVNIEAPGILAENLNQFYIQK